MTLSKKGQYWYGTTNLDIQSEAVRFSRLNGYEAVKFSSARCICGGDSFHLESDEEVGAARRVCSECGSIKLMGDSGEYEAKANFDDHVCVCSANIFAITSGVALYPDSGDVRWFYIGCRCETCSLVGVFAHWKCEGGNAVAFLAET
jgi:hypothetical protein